MQNKFVNFKSKRIDIGTDLVYAKTLKNAINIRALVLTNFRYYVKNEFN